MSLCLGHGVGAYGCYEEGTEALDSNGDGYCIIHDEFAREMSPNHAICPLCNYLSQTDEKGFSHWEHRGECYRCGGTGIDPVCIVP